MKRIILISVLLMLFIATNTFATDGACVQTQHGFIIKDKTQITKSKNSMVRFVCTSSSSDGSFPSIPFDTDTFKFVTGKTLMSVRAYVISGAKAPDVGDLKIKNSRLTDIFQKGTNFIPATGEKEFPPYNTDEDIFVFKAMNDPGGYSLVIENITTPSAVFVIELDLGEL